MFCGDDAGARDRGLALFDQHRGRSGRIEREEALAALPDPLLHQARGKAVFAEDQPLLQTSIRGFIGHPDVAYVAIYGERGKVLALGGKQLDEFKDVAAQLPDADMGRIFREGKPVNSTFTARQGRYAEFLVPVMSEQVRLPDELLTSFRATLDEMQASHLLLHLADASHPQVELQIDAVRRIVQQIGLARLPELLVFNKTDRIDQLELAEHWSLILPNRPHGCTEDPYFVRRRWDYFVRHLLGAEPPAGYQIGAGVAE